MIREKINVMHVVLNLEMGGSENCVVNIARKLDKDLFKVSVCCLESGGVLAKELDMIRVPVYTINKGSGFDMKTIWQLIKLLRKEKVDVINSHHLGPLIYSLPAAKIAGVKRIIHTEHSYKYMQESKKLFLIAKLLFNVVNKVVGVCDDVTSFLKDKMRMNPSRIMTILNGVDVKSFSDSGSTNLLEMRNGIGIAENDFVIGTVSRLDPIKNHEGLLTAFKDVLDIIPNARLIIVGDGELRNSLQNLAQELGVSSFVKFLGTRHDIPQLLQIMNVFILPSFSEGLSVALLEALASKIPVIASNVGGNKDIIRHDENGLLIPPGDKRALANAVIKLYENKEKAKSLGNSGYALVKEKYSVAVMTKAYQELYQKGS